jgi:hypothetical protein
MGCHPQARCFRQDLELGGGHAHVGMFIYQGGVWPKEYDGAMLTCNLHGNRINMDKLEREGCGYVGKHAPDFMKAKDKWFRGIDLLTGPDGNVFVVRLERFRRVPRQRRRAPDERTHLQDRVWGTEEGRAF